MSHIRPGADPSVYKFLLDRNQLPLPYGEYDEANQIYHMDDGGMTIIFECKPYGGINSEAGLTTAMNCLPEGAAMQILLLPSSDVTPITNAWKKNKSKNDEIYVLTRDQYADFVGKKTKEIVSPNMRTRISDYKLIITITLGGRSKEFSLFDMAFLFSSKNSNTVDHKDLFKKLLDIKNRMAAALSSANLYPVNMPPERLIRFIFTILNPSHQPRQIPSGRGNMRDLMIANDTVFEVAEDHIQFDNKYARSMSVKEYPYEWQCSAADHLIGHPFGLQTLEAQVMLCLNIINVGKPGINKVKRKSQVILSQNLPAHLFPLLGMKKQDLAMANKELERGKAIFHINMGIMAFADNYDELTNVCGQIQAYYQNLGFLLEEDKYINLPVLLSMLPGNYDERFKDDLGRGLVAFKENAVDLAPVASDWAGNTATAELLLFTPRGQVFSFDFFASSTNYNAFVVGTSGSGKSVLLQYLAINYLMSDNRVAIIDIGGSYENFCEILNGQYIDIRPENPISLNPWTAINSSDMFEEFKDFLASWYWLMGCPRNRQLAEEHEKFIKSYLVMALELSFERYNSESSVDTVIECFNEIASDDSRCCDFIQIMSLYASKGIYGSFFNEKAKIEFKSDLVVLETGSMENIPALRDPIITILTYHITKDIYLTKNIKRKHLVFIDEMHKFIGNPYMDELIEQAFRRFRKHLANMVLGTQGYEDFSDTRVGRVVIENSAFQIFMAQSPSSSEKLKQSTSHNFSEYEKAMIDSIKPIKGEYSEAMLIHEKIKVKIRVILDEWMKRIFFTTPEMRSYVRGRVKLGLTFREAIESMPKELIK